MIRKSMIAALALGFAATAAQAQTEIQFWHSMGGALGDKVNDLATKFNASQKDYKVVPGLQGHLPRVHDRGDRGLPRRAMRRTSCRSSRSAPRR